MSIAALVDNTLPQELALAADEQYMLTAFRRYFQQTYPDWVDRLGGCFVDQIRYKPGKYGRFLYRLHFTGATPFDQWFVGQMHVAGHPARPSKPVTMQTDPWLPQAYWDDMGMSLTAFPYDPALPQLPALLDPATVCAQAQPLAPLFGLSPEWACVAATIHQLKYMPRKRVVLRYDLRWQAPSGEQTERTVYSKTYSDDESSAIYAALDQLWLATEGAQLVVPRPLAHWQPIGTIWQAAWPGQNLGDVIGTMAAANDAGWLAYLPTVATGLAALHQHDFATTELRQMPSLTAVLTNVHGDQQDITDFFGKPVPAVDTIVTWLETTHAQLAADPTIPQTPIHGTFKMAQILVNGNAAAVVDFDSVAEGDPLYDVAEFVASLLVLNLKRDVATEQMVEAVAVFMQAYQTAVSWPCSPLRIRWYATAFMLARVHSLLKGLKIRDEAEFQTLLHTILYELPAVLAQA